MTDQELLELAAKAAGIKGSYVSLDEYPDWMTVHDGEGVYYTSSQAWNPLTNDGDALRLAVRLRLNIDHNHAADQQRWVAADRNGCEGCYAPVSCVEDDFEESERATATRRAIVRAAAEIGRTK